MRENSALADEHELISVRVVTHRQLRSTAIFIGRLAHQAAYVAWLEARASADGGKIEEAAMEALRRGWYLGQESFRDKLLGLMD